MVLKRDIGLVGLTFIAVGGVLGSGWLFAPLLTSQLAGPAALIAWSIGAIAMLLLALTFAEVTTMFPVAGGIARIPQLSHGRMLAMVLGWSAWAGYCTTAPIEVEAALGYASTYLPWLHTGESGGLTVAGYIVAALLLLLFTILNAFGVALFARINTAMTWFKLVVPLIVVVVLLYTQFEATNFTQHGGFAPYGVAGIFGAVASGGVVFAFIGFRHAIDMAGETSNPQRTIPLALIFAVLICFVVYGALQVSFIGGLPADQLAGGWSALSVDHSLGPLAGLATALGVLWLVSLLNVAAVISPFGGGLVSTGSNGRLALAIAKNGVFPKIFAKITEQGVPLAALLLNFAVGVVLLFALDFSEIVALNGAAIVLSFIVGPVAVIALRRLAPDRPRPFKLPAAYLLSGLAFVIATLMIYWSGWETMWRLILLLAIGFCVFGARLALGGREALEARGAYWILPFLAGLGLLSYLSGYGNGINVMPAVYDSLIVAAFAVIMFYFAIQAHLSKESFDAYMAEDDALHAHLHEAPQPAEAR